MFHLFWITRHDASAWHHEMFDDQQALDERCDALRQLDGAAPGATLLLRSFHFPEAVEGTLDVGELQAYLSRFACYEIQPGATTEREASEQKTTSASQSRNQALLRVGAKTYHLNEADTTILQDAIAEVTRMPASEEFLPLLAPDAVIVLVVDGVPAEYELYDDWTTLADLVTGHWPFPHGKVLREMLQAGLEHGQVREVPADQHGAD